jgi:hypothetical protein
MLDASEDGSVGAKRVARLKAKDQLCAALCAGVLGQEKEACLGLFCGCAIAEPCCQQHARGMLGCDATHVQDDRAEASTLQDQIRRL